MLARATERDMTSTTQRSAIGMAISFDALPSSQSVGACHVRRGLQTLNISSTVIVVCVCVCHALLDDANLWLFSPFPTSFPAATMSLEMDGHSGHSSVCTHQTMPNTNQPYLGASSTSPRPQRCDTRETPRALRGHAGCAGDGLTVW